GVGWPVRTDTAANFPIDAVYTWVDASDPGWREQLARFRDPATVDPDRFNQSDELRYSLRSLDLFAPWVRRIHIVSNCPPPAWFKPSDRVRWVDHSAFIPSDYLPLFSSRAIETFLHRVPELSEYFIYLCDDWLLWNDVVPSSFFTADGKTVAHLAPQGAVVSWWQAVDAGTAPDWQSARVNGARLILERYGVLPTRQHQHVPHALRRSTMEAMEAEFPEAFESSRHSRFRAPSDISLMALAYHHWAALRGLGITAVARQLTIDGHSIGSVDADQLAAIDFLCVNDAGGSALDPSARAAKQKLFATRLPIASSAEAV
ncbi:MAG: stealth conserved region 3 domain-containing protein, partial [Candidatus Limnocylindrales bacterium]